MLKELDLLQEKLDLESKLRECDLLQKKIQQEKLQQKLLQEKIQEEKSSTDKIEKQSCAICLEKYTLPTVITKCGHIYCNKCIISVLSTNNKKCPACRIDITKSDLLRVYF